MNIRTVAASRPASRPSAARAVTPTAKPAAPAVVVKAKAAAAPEQGTHKIRRHETIMGAIGGAGGGVIVSLLLGMVNAMGASIPALALLAPIPVLAAAGAGFGFVWGSMKEKLFGKFFKNPESQWSAYWTGGMALSNAGTLLKGAGKAGALGGLGNVAVGAWQAAKEYQALKREGGTQTADNKLRLGGSLAAVAGGGLALATALPALAGAAPVLLPLGAGIALAGWGANVVGQFRNESRNDAAAE